MASGERWATFDCYGTLIDWNGGIGRELERLFGAARGGELLHAYHELEPQIQREEPSRSYREVMAVSLARLGAPAAEQDALGRSLPKWEPFPEVPAALDETRARGWRLAVLSNTGPRLPRGVARASRGRLRADRRGLRDRLVQAGGGALGRVLRAERGRARAPRPRGSQLVPRHRAGLGARPADHLDQPTRRRGRAAAGRRAAEPVRFADGLDSLVPA